MDRDEYVPLTQLVTRVPLDLRKRTRVHCVERDVTLTRFVVEALEEALAVARHPPARKPANARSRPAAGEDVRDNGVLA